MLGALFVVDYRDALPMLLGALSPRSDGTERTGAAQRVERRGQQGEERRCVQCSRVTLWDGRARAVLTD